MTQQQWESVKACFFAALSLEGAERDQYLLTLRTDSPEVASLVGELLAEGSSSGLDLRNPCWLAERPGARLQASARAFEVGQVLLDRFEIEAFLGAGGVGEVYRVRDRVQQTALALKTPRAALAADPAALAILRNELNTARAITHPNVCRLHDIHVGSGDKDFPFFTMELVDGVTLKELLRVHGPLAPEAAQGLAEQLIRALQAAHARGIIHRDLKPTNVMVTGGGSRLVVMDFGLAREVAAGADLQTTVTAMAGTPAYMAPEQLRGGRASFASDIYALGVVLFEMVTGRLPFRGDTPAEIAASKLSDMVPSPRKFSRGVSLAWENAILRCLEQDPVRRPGSVEEVLALMTDRPLRLMARRALLVGAVGGGVAAALTGAGALARRSRQIRVEVFDFDASGGQAEETGYLCSGLAREIVRRLSAIEGVVAVPRYKPRTGAADGGSADFVFGGTLEGADGRYRVNVQLIRPREGRVLWSGNFDRRRGDDRLDVQVEIARSAVLELRNALVRTRALSVAGFPGFGRGVPHSHPGSATESGLAFDHYLQGLEALRHGTADSVSAAVDLLERAVSEDGQFSLAHAALAEAELLRMNFGDTPERQYMRAAHLHALAALESGPLVPEAHAIHAAVRQAQWDWEGARRSYDRALELRPNFARALRWRAGLHLQFARFDEALGGMQRAYALDPFNESAIAGHGLTLLFADRAAEAVAFLEKHIGGQALPVARYNLAQAYLRWGAQSSGAHASWCLRRALGEAEKVARGTGQGSALPHLTFALCHAASGRAASAEPHLRALTESAAAGRTSPVHVAMVLAVQHRVEDALQQIERGLSLRSRELMYLRVNVFLENVRSHPRCQWALRRLRLTG